MARKKIPGGLEGVGLVVAFPWTEDNRVNVDTIHKHVDFLIKNGVRTLVPCGGGIGQGQLLSLEEWREAIGAYKDAIGNRATLIAGHTGRFATADWVKQVKWAGEIGCDAVKFWPGYFIRRFDENAITKHWKAAFEATDLPVLIYNNWGHGRDPLENAMRFNLPVSFLAKVADEFDSFAGLKTNNWDELPYEIKELTKRGIDVAFGVWEKNYLGALFMGVKGFISVVANVVPDRINEIYQAFKAGDYMKAQGIIFELLPLLEWQGWGRAPYHGVYSHILNQMGFEFGRPRQPAEMPTEEQKKLIDKLLEKMDLIGKAKRF